MVKKTFQRARTKETVEAIKLDFQPVYDNTFDDLIKKLDQIDFKRKA